MAETAFTIEGDPPKDLKVTISLGTSSTVVQDDNRILGLLEQADGALYYSKSDGRNRVTAAEDLHD